MVHFEENAEYKIVAGDEINITSFDNINETGNSYTELIFGSRYSYKNNSELEFYTAPCEWTEEQCGFNYFKMANAGSNTNNTFVEKENESTEIKIHPNPTTHNTTLTLIGYQNKNLEILVLDQSGKTIFSKIISKVENKEQTIEIESKDWGNSVYIIRVINGNEAKVMKLLKK